MRIKYNDRLLAHVRPDMRSETASHRGHMAQHKPDAGDTVDVIWDHAKHIGIVQENWSNLCEAR